MSAAHFETTGVRSPAHTGRADRELFGEQYFRQYGAWSMPAGVVPYDRDGPWPALFSGIADQIVRSLRPRRALDAGCAMGFLVEALWDRGVECRGIDISDFAISRVRRDMQPHCRVASITEPVGGFFDLAICIEVLEHLDPQDTKVAIANLCSAADRILFSSTPDDFTEPTHFNVRPIFDWLRLFAACGFYPVLDYNASFVAQHAFLLERRGLAFPDEVLAMFAAHLRQRRELGEQYGRAQDLERRLGEAAAQALGADERAFALGQDNAELRTAADRFGETNARLSESLSALERLPQQLAALTEENKRLQHSLRRLASLGESQKAELDSLRRIGAELEDVRKQRDFLISAMEKAREDQAREAVTRDAEVQQLATESSQLRVRCARLEERLFQIEGSSGWRAVVRYREWRRDFFGRGSRAEQLFERMVHGWLPSAEPEAHVALPKAPVSPLQPDPEMPAAAPVEGTHEVARFALIVSGCPGDSFRYRAEYQAEQLRHLGLAVDIALFDEVEYERVLTQYQVFLFHRVPITPGIEAFLGTARSLGRLVLFDTDDLVFNEELSADIKALETMAPRDRELYLDGIRRYRKTLALAMGAIATTETLAREIRELFPETPVEVNRNAMGDMMVQQAEAAMCELPKPDDGLVRIAYFSGTPTHNHDFAVCAGVLARLLERHANLRLMIVGHLDLPGELLRHASRIERTPLVPWRELPRLMRRADINLAPLEMDNRFTEAKSELKYYEAALLELPTVASDLPSFRTAIRSGENGYLCTGEGCWTSALEQLILSEDLRRRVGKAARADVVSRYTTRARAPELGAVLSRLSTSLLPRSSRKLSVAIVARAPIANTGGGYRTLFELGHGLARRGHDVHFYVEAIAHLAGKTDEEIREFCGKHFGESPARVHVGHDGIRRCDVAVATNWPTAYTVARLSNALLRVYLVQDEEQNFYDPADPLYREAERTYSLPLRKVTVGGHLARVFSERDRLPAPHLDFCLDQTVFYDRKLRAADRVRVLFFARPGLKRRAYPVGVAALGELKRRCPEVEIAFYGMKESEPVGFPYENLGELSREQVALEMSRSHVHLSFSLSNISWVPFEAMACGCAVVEADSPTVTGMLPRDAGLFVRPEPAAVAAALERIVRNPPLREQLAARGRDFLAERPAGWDAVCTQFEGILYGSLPLPWKPE
ncbi:MAG: glycosyltransferase [Bryobacteraceae bacterium]